MSAKFHSELWIGRLAIVVGIGLCTIAWSDGIGSRPPLLERLQNLSGQKMIDSALMLLGMGLALCGAGLVERRNWARWGLEALCWAGLFSAVVVGIWIVPAGIFQNSLWLGSGWYSLLFLLEELASFAWTLALAIPWVAMLIILRSSSPRDSTRYLY